MRKNYLTRYSAGGEIKSAINMQVKSIVNSGRILNNRALPILGEYYSREKLARLGYFDSIDELDSHTADLFLYIGAEMDKALTKKIGKK